MVRALLLLIVSELFCYPQSGLKDPVFVSKLKPSAVTSPTPELVWWKLNDGSGTALTGDSSSGGDDGTTDASWVTGASGSGYALSFNGTSQDAVTDSSITYGTNIISVSCWVQFGATNGTKIVLESSTNYNNNAHAWEVNTDATGILSAGIRGGGAGQYRIETVALPNINIWTHYLFIFDNSTTAGDVRIFINASEASTTVTSNTKTSSANFNAYKIFAMARNSASAFLSGSLDDVRVYSTDKSANASEIYNDSQ